MTSTQKIMGLAGVVVAIIAIIIATRKDDPPKTTDVPTPTSVKIDDPALPTNNTATATGSSPAPIVSGKPLDVAELADEAKLVENARTLLRGGEPRKALEELQRYDRRFQSNGSLKQEETLLKIEALSKVGRKTDALALGMSTRDDPSFQPYRARVEATLTDAGLIGEVAPPVTP